MRTIRCIIFTSIFSFIAFAAERPTYEFLRHDVSARASAMAGSFVSMSGDPVGIFYNPATIGTAVNPQAVFGYTNNFLDINEGFVSYAQEFEALGVIGLGVNYINYGTMDETDNFSNKLGTFSAGDMALSLSAARLIDENLYAGLTGKFIYSSIASSSSSAVAFDAGLMYLIPGDDPISLGISLTNVGTQLDPYVNTKELLPVELKIGGTIKPQHLPLQLNLNFRKLNEDADSFIDRFNAFTVGGEFTLSKALRFRFGYNNEQRKELKMGTSAGMAGFSLGGGLVLKNLRLDYSYTSFNLLGTISRITLALDV